MAAIFVGIPLSAIGAIAPNVTWLHVGPVALLLPAAIVFLRRWPIGNDAAACVTGFVLLHLFAAHWTYSSVPYEDWLGFIGWDDLTQLLSFDRNMFDRLVHFAFGLLAVIPFAELSIRYGNLSQKKAAIASVMFVLAIGGLYEIFEWALTIGLSPQQAGAYNGEQGDIFDAQKDMAIAALGAMLALPWLRWKFGKG